MSSSINLNGTSDPLDEGPAKVETSGNPSVDVREQSHELIAIAMGPLVWVVHFLASYLTNAIYCAKLATAGEDASVVRVAILVFTAIALPLIGFIGWYSYQRHRYQGGELPHDADSPEDRFRFLGFAGFLLSLLSFVAVIFTALVAVFIHSCD